jgi:tRNA threonylcarbamoyl adenosine modification protein (Sua5/YciO/YrdC/YwlC family)
VILLPTETFYGLGAAARDPAAVARVFEMKDRPRDAALPVLCADRAQLESLVELPERHRVRLSRIWPGALTVVLPCRRELPAAWEGALAVRIPDHPLLRTLLYRVGPLTGTSANRHGEAPCTEPDEALASLVMPPELVLDGGATPGGSATTVVDLRADEARVLRVGELAWDEPYPWPE